MTSNPNTQRYLDIPGEKTLIYNFKFNMDLPPPVPPLKTMYIPLDPDRYVKPKLTLFHVKRKANLMADINLSIPVDEVNMSPELYNPPPDARFELSEKDRELLEEKPAIQVKKEAPAEKHETPTTTNGKNQPASQKSKEATPTPKPQQAASKDKHKEAGHAKKPEAAPKKKEDPKKLPIDDYVKKTFEIASSYTVGSQHPSKEGLQCQEVFEIVPDLANLITEAFAVKAEVSAETLKLGQNLFKFETDLDKKPILAVFMNTPLNEGHKGMEEEEETKGSGDADDSLLKRVENFEHVGNYVYSQPKKELLLNVNKTAGKAYVYHTQPIVLKKKKVLFMNKTVVKDDEMEEEKKPKERKRTVKILKKEGNKDDLLAKKKKLKELHLENTSHYKKNSQALEKYKDDEDDELEILKRKFMVEEEEEEAEEEKEEEPEKEKDEDEEEAQFNEEKEDEEHEEREEEEKVEREKMEVEEEVQYNPGSPKEEAKKEKQEKATSEDEAGAQELADFFADSDDDDD